MAALRSKLEVPVSTPLTQLASSGAIQLAWDTGRFYLDIDVFPDGRHQWFFRDRTGGEVDASVDDELLNDVSRELLQRLDLVSR
jgi:hypothetical protein